MPLDGTNWKVKIKPLQTGVAGLKQLGDVLRYTIPAYWNWIFSKLGDDTTCGTFGCAAGLARRLWPSQVLQARIDSLAFALQLPLNDLIPIFGMPLQHECDKKAKDITPHDVADAIDRYIAGKGGAK